tara:strand:+ start:27538 stop:28737 length:1200 start_codon:yes stop_codon:yes gene_type:complete
MNLYFIDAFNDHMFSKPLTLRDANYSAKYKYLLMRENWPKSVKDLYMISCDSINENHFKKWNILNNIQIKSIKQSENKVRINDMYFITGKTLIQNFKKSSLFRVFIIDLSKRSNLYILINHFFNIVESINPILEDIDKSFLICERDPRICSKFLKESEIKNLNRLKVIEFPYIPRNDLLNQKEFETRIKKCSIIGNTHEIASNHHFRKRTGALYFSSLRGYCRKLFLEKNLDKNFFNYYGGIDSQKYKVKFLSSNIARVLLKIPIIRGILFRLVNYLDRSNSKRYYQSFNMSDVLKNHMIALCGEEDILQLPVIGFYEALISGCVPLGSLHSFYEKQGLKKSVHYLPFNGGYKDAIRAVNEGLSSIENLEKISKNGIKYCNQKLNPKNLVKILINSKNN